MSANIELGAGRHARIGVDAPVPDASVLSLAPRHTRSDSTGPGPDQKNGRGGP